MMHNKHSGKVLPIVIVVIVVGLGVVSQLYRFGKKEQEKEQIKAVEDYKKKMENINKRIKQDIETHGEITPETQKLIDETEALTKKLGKSDNKKIQEASKFNLALLQRLKPLDDQFGTIIESIHSDRFLNFQEMVAKNDFKWNKDVCTQYHDVAEKSIKLESSMNSFAKQQIKKSNLSERVKKAMYTAYARNYQKLIPKKIKVYNSHLKAGKSYLNLIVFVEKNKDKCDFNDQGSIVYEDEDLLKKYDKLVDEQNATVAELQKSIKDLVQ